MTGMDGIELLQQLLALDSSIIVILLTAHGTIDSAKDALRRGAFDYLQKPFEREALLQTIKRALGTLDRIDVEIISASPKMEAVKKMILKVARSSSTVLIRGESGTGKELIARAIHNQSPRSSDMFQAVNCAAINENLLESELFGHEKGSFTGAHADKKGLFEVADRGTLFLDEIAELDVSMQAKLLRALQERRIRRVGGTHEISVVPNLVLLKGIIFITPVLILLGAVGLSLTGRQGGGKIRNHQEDRERSKEQPVNDDEHWKLGFIYFNANDPSFTVEKRYGIGWTINFARPLSWVLLLFIIAIVVISIVLSK